jgi:hypothetical protein
VFGASLKEKGKVHQVFKSNQNNENSITAPVSSWGW